jgi:hypothetical protein
MIIDRIREDTVVLGRGVKQNADMRVVEDGVGGDIIAVGGSGKFDTMGRIIVDGVGEDEVVFGIAGVYTDSITVEGIARNVRKVGIPFDR